MKSKSKSQSHLKLSLKLLTLLAVLMLTGVAPARASSMPDAATFSDALSAARIAWGANDPAPIEFRIEPLNACVIGSTDIIAVTQPYTTVTTMTFTDEAGVAHSTESRQTRWVIRFNSNCDWSKLSFYNTMIHEYGHVLISNGYHSQNPRSIMYFVVWQSGQVITPEDRKALADVQQQAVAAL